MVTTLAQPVFVPAPSRAVDARFPPTVSALSDPTVPSLSLPTHLVPFTDPTFGTQVVRITNTNLLRHNYSKLPAWNYDGSLLLMNWAPNYQVLDGSTYALLYTLGTMVGYHCWSPTEKFYLYGTWDGDNRLYREDVRDGSLTTVHTFTGYDHVALGNGEGILSADGRYCLLSARAGTAWTMLVYDFHTDTIQSSRSTGTIEPSGPTISPSGQYVLDDWLAATGPAGEHDFEIYNASDFSFRSRNTHSSHFDCGYDIAGNEVIVFCESTIPMIRLSDGVEQAQAPSGTVFAEGHISMRCHRRPGWAYFSQYSNSAGNGHGQVVAVKLDGSGKFQVFAHTHHTAAGYEKEPHACVSPDGRRVVFASEWDGGANVYDYVAGVTV